VSKLNSAETVSLAAGSQAREGAADLAAPRVNGLVGLLADHRPEALDALRVRYPEQAQVLRPGTMMGSSTVDSLLLVELALEGLRVVQARAEPNLRRLRSRLARAKNLRLAGNVVATLTGAGLIAALVADADLLAKIAAVVNFAVSLFALGAAHLETPVYGGPGSLLQSYETLVNAAARAEQLSAELEACLRVKARPAQALELVRRANELAGELRVAERAL
jgi:hypothetical protein